MSKQTNEVSWFSGEYKGQPYKLPVYDMNGHDFVLDSVDVGKLEVDAEAQPRQKNDFQIQYLVSSIRKKVLMQPLLVRYDKKRDKYLITEGQHRYFACMQLGMARIPCIIYTDMDKSLALMCGIEANDEDRAKGLSGGDMAAKVQSIWDETRKQLEEADPTQKATEERILRKLEHSSKGQQRKYIVSYKLKLVLDSPNSLLRKFVADKQDQNTPITTKNLDFFLRRIMRTLPAEEKDENLREDETKTLLDLTNIIAKTILVGKWNPNAIDEMAALAHAHAKNICRRHPFEALGQLCAEILHDEGGAHYSGGAAFCKHSAINWKKVETRMVDLLNSHVWDDPMVYLDRGVNDILRTITGVVKP
jgi:ParB/RepB/Spo0J family partition protein